VVSAAGAQSVPRTAAGASELAATGGLAATAADGLAGAEVASGGTGAEAAGAERGGGPLAVARGAIGTGGPAAGGPTGTTAPGEAGVASALAAGPIRRAADGAAAGPDALGVVGTQPVRRTAGSAPQLAATGGSAATTADLVSGAEGASGGTGAAATGAEPGGGPLAVARGAIGMGGAVAGGLAATSVPGEVVAGPALAAGPTHRAAGGAQSGLDVVSAAEAQSVPRTAAGAPQLAGTGFASNPATPMPTSGMMDGGEDAGGPSGEPGTRLAAGMVEPPGMGALRSLAGVPVSLIEGGAGPIVDIAEPEGPGGLGAAYTPDVGVNHRRAARDSLEINAGLARFVRKQVGGNPSFDTSAVVAARPFRGRTVPDLRGGGHGGGGRPRGLGGPPPETDDTVEMGLVFLARHQSTDGRWSLRAAPGEEVSLTTDTAATALALLAFQGAGYNHREHRYAGAVKAGIAYLLQHQKPDGDLYEPLDVDSTRSVWLYSHGLASLALSEAYGMTQDPALREPAQKALDWIVQSQHPSRGGWRYAPNYGSDTSVTGWMMMALKSGECAGLKVPPEAYQRIREWLDKSQASKDDPHLYCYNPYAPDTDAQRHGRVTSKTMTSVGLLMRLYTGWRRDNPNMVLGAQYLAENLPSLGTTQNPQRDTYYWYYGTQVMFHMGGEYWRAWNDRLHPLLVTAQIKDGPLAGSWDPRNPVPDRWASHAGRLYVTTMNLLSLEIYYRHLPLYEDTLR
jgi:hypothetical protein